MSVGYPELCNLNAAHDHGLNGLADSLTSCRFLCARTGIPRMRIRVSGIRVPLPGKRLPWIQKKSTIIENFK